MDYLINEGYPVAAKNFASEAKIQPTEDFASIQERVEIRNAIHQGDIQKAIEKINDLGHQILDSNAELHFSLLRLQLVELIRTAIATPGGDIFPAIAFARAELAPRAPTNPKFLDDLESTMALLIFPSDDLAPSLAVLLEPSLRKRIANDVNEAILVSQGARRESKIRSLVRLRAWAEQKAREAKKDLPSHLRLGLDNEVEGQNGGHDTIMQENGGEDANDGNDGNESI
ncbi:MAG: hypothetical protein M1825_003156 [Sarcosagium campestre]|nr:MAG: hypothetical protein M1825_003156 [Sarcosagium campestre]